MPVMEQRESTSWGNYGFVLNVHEGVSFVHTENGTILLSDRSKNLSGGDPPGVAEWIRFTSRTSKRSNRKSKWRTYVDKYEKIPPPHEIPITVSIKNERAWVKCEVRTVGRDENNIIIFHNEFLGNVRDLSNVLTRPSDIKQYSVVVTSVRDSRVGSVFTIIHCLASCVCVAFTRSEKDILLRRVNNEVSKEEKMSAPNDPEIRDRSQEGFVRGLCCRDFLVTKVIWTQKGSAVLEETLSPAHGQKAKLGMWIWCKVRPSNKGFLAYQERYRYLVTEYEEAPLLSDVATVNKNNHFLMVDIDIWLTSPMQNLYESAVFLEIFDTRKIIRRPQMDMIYRVRLRNHPVDDGDGCLRLNWSIQKLANPSENRTRSVVMLNEPAVRLLPSSSPQPSTSGFARVSLETTAHYDAHEESNTPGRVSVFQNDGSKIEYVSRASTGVSEDGGVENTNDSRTQRHNHVEECDIYDSDELDDHNDAESFSDGIVEDESQSLPPVQQFDRDVPPSPLDVRGQTWEQVCRQMMTYKNVRSAMRDSNPSLFDDIVEKLLERS